MPKKKGGATKDLLKGKVIKELKKIEETEEKLVRLDKQLEKKLASESELLRTETIVLGLFLVFFGFISFLSERGYLLEVPFTLTPTLFVLFGIFLILIALRPFLIYKS